MTTRYDVTNLRDTLRIQVIADVPMWERLLASAVVCIGLIGITGQLLGLWTLPLALAGSVAMFCGHRVRKEGLTVTKLEFNTTGGGGHRGARRPRTVFTADVVHLKFDVGSHFGTSNGDGLYAVTKSGQVLLLPGMEFRQTIEVIEAIQDKFPSLAEQWRSGAKEWPL